MGMSMVRTMTRKAATKFWRCDPKMAQIILRHFSSGPGEAINEDAQGHDQRALRRWSWRNALRMNSRLTWRPGVRLETEQHR